MAPVKVTVSRIAPLDTAHTSPASGSQQMAPSTCAASGDAAKCLAPSISPSSSTSAATTSRPGNGPASTTALAAYSIAARPDFMSALPRPRSRPSTMSPA